MKQVEPILDTTKPTYTFSRMQPNGERGLVRRTGVLTAGALDFGFSYFGDNAAPQAFKEWTWGGRILTHKKPDTERDKLMAACGGGEPQRLVWTHDDGWERVITGSLKEIVWPRHTDDDYYVDARVTWLILENWHERGPATGIICGLGPPIIAGVGPAIIAGSQSFPILGGGGTSTYVFPTSTTPIADASVAGVGGIPNHPDTAPVINVVGPMGGDFGFILYNFAATIVDMNGATINPQIGVELFVPPGANCKIDCAAQRITLDGVGDVTNLKFKQDAQPYWFVVKEGVNNGIGIASNGPNGINSYQAVSMIAPFPTTGTFQLRVTPPGQTVQTTGFLAFNSTPAQVQAALEPMGGLGAGQVRVTAFLNPADGRYYNANGNPGYNVMFIGTQAGASIPTMTSVNTFNQGTISIATINGSLSLLWTRRYR